jgi:hypothetical protein
MHLHTTTRELPHSVEYETAPGFAGGPFAPGYDAEVEILSVTIDLPNGVAFCIPAHELSREAVEGFEREIKKSADSR